MCFFLVIKKCCTFAIIIECGLQYGGVEWVDRDLYDGKLLCGKCSHGGRKEGRRRKKWTVYTENNSMHCSISQRLERGVAILRLANVFLAAPFLHFYFYLHFYYIRVNRKEYPWLFLQLSCTVQYRWERAWCVVRQSRPISHIFTGMVTVTELIQFNSIE